MDISPLGQKFSQGDSAEPRHTGETFLIPWVRYPYPTWILMMDSNILDPKWKFHANMKPYIWATVNWDGSNGIDLHLLNVSYKGLMFMVYLWLYYVDSSFNFCQYQCILIRFIQSNCKFYYYAEILSIGIVLYDGYISL